MIELETGSNHDDLSINLIETVIILLSNSAAFVQDKMEELFQLTV